MVVVSLISNTVLGWEPGVWMAVCLIGAAVLLNTFAYRAWQRCYIGDWYNLTIAAATGAMLVATGLQSVGLGMVGAVVLLGLGAYGTAVWFRTSNKDEPRR